MEEERRLCYVGITRAKRKVYLVRAFRRNLMGRSMVSEPSRFLADIPKHLISGSDWRDGGKKSNINASVYSWNKPTALGTDSISLPDVKSGDHVRHAEFGNGVVVSCKKVKGDSEVVVAFNGSVKKLLLSFANLEPAE
jgi:DNA helicase-2/ATP-dependent DNA helicase PcrA